MINSVDLFKSIVISIYLTHFRSQIKGRDARKIKVPGITNLLYFEAYKSPDFIINIDCGRAVIIPTQM